MAGCVTQKEKSFGLKTLEFTEFGGHADFVVRREERELKSKTGISDTRSKETILEESLSLETKGYAFHPNVVEFGLGAVFGLVQEDFEDLIDGRKRDVSNSGDLLEFNIEAQILKKRSYPMTVFAQRRRGIVPRPFLPSLESTSTNYGLTWQYVSKKIPMSLHFSHTDAKLSPLFISGEAEEEGRQKTTEFRLESDYHSSDYSTLSLIYEHKSVDEEPFALQYDADEVTLTHRVEMGDKHQHRLRSELNYLDQRGTTAIERVRWRENLRLKHSDSLQSEFRFEALDRSFQGRSRNVPRVEERSLRLSGSLRHQLFLSQTMQLRMFAQKQEFEPDLDITRWGGQFNFNYRKTNRWGVLYANYGLRLERIDHTGADRANEAIDEVHTFRDPAPITLGNRNIIVSSITLRALDRVTFYQRGRDFTVRTIGNLVEIERTPTGRIADGETVTVDYLFNLGGAFELDSLAHNFGIRQNFEFGLTPYYRFEWQDQTVSSAGDAGAIAEDITAHVVGVEYQKSALRLFAEHEDRESTINPFARLHLGASYTHRFKSGAEMSLNTRWTDTSFDAPNSRDVKLLTVEGRHRHPITPTLTVEGSVLYREGEDSVVGDTDGVELLLSLEWFVRQMTVKISFEHTEFEDRFALNDSSALFVHIRRGL